MGKLISAIISEQRWRESMEDTHCLVANFLGKKDWFFGGVFDGHCGADIAYELANHMADFMGEELLRGKTPRRAFLGAYAKASSATWAQTALMGSCAATFLIQGRTVTCANVGDCRIIVTGESARQLTVDHDTKNPAEAERIRQHGVIIDGQGYVDYKESLLAPTRVIGDLDFRDAGVISIPFTGSYPLKKNDKFIIAASDGLFGKTSNEEVFDIAFKAQTAAELARLLRQEVERRSGGDNLTIIVIQVCD